MKSVIENLRNLSKAHRKRLDKAERVAANMKRIADEAAKAAREAKHEKE